MGMQRAHVILPEELIEAIDSLVGARGRSAFLVEVAQAEVKRRRLLEFLRSPKPAWSDEDHPELVEKGTADWVKEMRQQADAHSRARMAGHEEKQESEK